MSKIWLTKSLESALSEPPSTVNMFIGAKHLWNIHERSFIIFFYITLRRNGLENVSLIEILNLGGFCKHIDWRRQISCSGLWEFAVYYSNVIILKTKTFCQFFVPIIKSPSDFKHFRKKYHRDSWFISDIIDCQKPG